jgi:hypothetical protein
MSRRIIFITLCAAFMAASTPRTHAFDDHSFEAVAADVIVVRPLCFVATVIGSVLFVAALPVTLISKSTPQTAEALVGRPGRATFTRPMGDLSSLVD